MSTYNIVKHVFAGHSVILSSLIRIIIIKLIKAIKTAQTSVPHLIKERIAEVSVLQVEFAIPLLKCFHARLVYHASPEACHT